MLRTTFSPLLLPNLGLWLDAACASSYTVGTGVSEWRDISGNGLTFSQTIANNQPATSTLNGVAAIQFDTTDDFMDAGTSSLAKNVSGTTSFCVATFASFGASGNGIYTVSRGDGTAVTRQSVIAAATASGGWYLAGRPVDGTATTGINGGASATSTAYIIRTVFNYSAATASLHTNNTQRVSTAYGVSTTSSNTDSQRTRIGGVLANTNTPMRGTLGELIFYNRVLASAEITAVERYLSRKWGIALA